MLLWNKCDEVVPYTLIGTWVHGGMAVPVEWLMLKASRPVPAAIMSVTLSPEFQRNQSK